MNPIEIDYDGEFGLEMQLVIPYAYYLHQKNLLGRTTSAQDTRCLYYFAPQHKEKYRTRRWIDPDEPPRRMLPNRTEHTFHLNTSQWTPPPYRKQFANRRFVWDKEPLVIMNKFCIEWGERSYNFIDVPILEQIIATLKDRYQLIYCRPRTEDIVADDNAIRSFGDFDLIDRHFPEVLTIQRLHQQNPDLSFNTLQFMVYANCRRFISVQGGTSVLASYFGGSNIIYVVKGDELTHGDYNHFPLYSGARICPCFSEANLLACVRKIYSHRAIFARPVIFRQFARYNARVFLPKFYQIPLRLLRSFAQFARVRSKV